MPPSEQFPPVPFHRIVSFSLAFSSFCPYGHIVAQQFLRNSPQKYVQTENTTFVHSRLSAQLIAFM